MNLKSLAFLVVLAADAPAALTFTLPGNSRKDTWSTLNSANRTPNATSTDPWGPFLSDAGTATFAKTSGPAYFISSNAGIYGWHTAGSGYSIAESVPIDDLATIVFETRMNQAVSVVLNYNGGNQNLVATFSAISTVSAGISDYAWQWDLSAIPVEITRYEIVVDAPPSTFIYSSSPVTLSTSDTFTQVIPEPASGLALLGSAGLLALRRRRA